MEEYIIMEKPNKEINDTILKILKKNRRRDIIRNI